MDVMPTFQSGYSFYVPDRNMADCANIDMFLEELPNDVPHSECMDGLLTQIWERILRERRRIPIWAGRELLVYGGDGVSR